MFKSVYFYSLKTHLLMDQQREEGNFNQGREFLRVDGNFSHHLSSGGSRNREVCWEKSGQEL